MEAAVVGWGHFKKNKKKLKQKLHSAQQLNPIPLIPVGMPERQTPIGYYLN